jgi:uncharacterized OsmC-like protein
METMVKTGVRNGLDVDRMIETAGLLAAQPALGAFEFRTRNHWVRGGHNVSSIREFYGAGQEDTSRAAAFTVHNDEPDVLLGTDCGANPVEYVLHALAGCLTTSLVLHATARGITLRSVESTLSGRLDVRGLLDLAPEVRNGYSDIRVTFRVDADASDAEIAELVQVAQQRSPVFDIVSNGVPVAVERQGR